MQFRKLWSETVQQQQRAANRQVAAGPGAAHQSAALQRSGPGVATNIAPRPALAGNATLLHMGANQAHAMPMSGASAAIARSAEERRLTDKRMEEEREAREAAKLRQKQAALREKERKAELREAEKAQREELKRQKAEEKEAEKARKAHEREVVRSRSGLGCSEDGLSASTEHHDA